MTEQARYKTRSFQKLYEAMLLAAADKGSELYYLGRPHRGAGHRSAFWDGYAGLGRTANVIPGTPSAVCFQAGKEFARTNPGIAIEEATWTPGVTRQGEKPAQARKAP
jgi:hypothetical protein